MSIPSTAPSAEATKSLHVACVQMTPSANVQANRATIEQAIHNAAAAKAKVLLTPECALCGYPSAVRDDLSDINWCHYADEEDLLHIRAEQAGIHLILGTASVRSTTNGQQTISNDAFICGASTPQRYHKRCLTPLDTNHFVAGTKPLITTINGWRCGISICFDLRFPTVWADQLRAGADAFLSIAHMAGPDVDEGVKPTIIPAHYMSRAAENATPLALCNTVDKQSWVPSGGWDARGMPIPTRNENNLILFNLPHRNNHHDWYGRIYTQQLEQE